MRSAWLITPVCVLVAAACTTDTPVAPASPELEGARPTLSRVGAPLVVDDDAADCPHAGHATIQAAVDAADPEATILVCAGTYGERVLISGEAKKGLRLLAQGAPGTVVVDGENPAFFPGNHAFHLVNVSGVLVEGFTLRGYFENIRLTSATNNTIRRLRTTGAGHDGIILVNSAANVVEHNVSFDNPSPNACGINVVGPGSVGNLIRHNVVSNNNWGINVQGGPGDNIVVDNVAANNRSHGILNRGSSGTRIENNYVSANGAGGASNVFPGGPRAGIGVQTVVTPPDVPDIPSNNVTVARNRVFDQFDMVVDLFWDEEGAGNVFTGNHCTTSDPEGLCAHTDGTSD